MQPRHSFLLTALTVGAFAIGLDAYVVLGALEAVMRDLAIAPATAGWIVSAYAFCYALFAPLNAWAFRRWSRRNLLILSAIIFSAGNLLAGLAPDFVLLIAGRVVSAFGAAMFTPAATALATELLPPERKGFALSLIFGGMTVAQAAGVPLTAWIAATLDWRYAFFFVVIFGVVAALLLVGLPAGLPLGRVQPVAGEGRQALPGPVYGLLAVTFLIVTAEFAVYSYVSLLFAETTLRDVPVLPAVLFAYGVGAVLGNVATGVFTDRVGPALVLLIAVGVQTLLLVALVLVRAHAGLAVALAFLWGIVSYMYLVPIQHRLLEWAAGMANFALAANSALIYVGIGMGGWIGGRVIEALGVDALAGTTALLGGTALLSATVFMRQRSSS